MAVSLPVVATDMPGAREALGGRDDDVLIAPHDASALAAAILRLACDADLRRRVGKANRAKVEERERRAAPTTTWTALLADAVSNGGP